MKPPKRQIKNFNSAARWQGHRALKNAHLILPEDLEELGQLGGEQLNSDKRREDALNDINVAFRQSFDSSVFDGSLSSRSDCRIRCQIIEKRCAQLLDALGGRDIEERDAACLIELSPWSPHQAQLSREIDIINQKMNFNIKPLAVADDTARKFPLKIYARSTAGKNTENRLTRDEIYNSMEINSLILQDIMDRIKILRNYSNIIWNTSNFPQKKSTFGRSYTRNLFRCLASSYYDIFRCPPPVYDTARGLSGPATQWAIRILQLSAPRLKAHLATLDRQDITHIKPWLSVMMSTLGGIGGHGSAGDRSGGLADTTIGKRLRAGWKEEERWRLARFGKLKRG